jgi:hypothetical protein
MKSYLTFGRVAFSLCSILAVASAQNRTFTKQYSFGDSLSDGGHLVAATSALGAGTPGAPYFQGRFSNGRVFTELLGTNMALAATAPTSVKSGLNFAFGGATAGGAGTLPPSMGVQIGLYQSRAIVPTKTDLFTVFFGANDLIPVLSAPATALIRRIWTRRARPRRSRLRAACSLWSASGRKTSWSRVCLIWGRRRARWRSGARHRRLGCARVRRSTPNCSPGSGRSRRVRRRPM